MIHESQLRPKALVFDDMEKDQIIAEGVPEEQGKFCADCKHLIGVRYNSNEKGNWNCGHPINDDGMDAPDLVTGLKKRKFKMTIYDLRYTEQSSLCGVLGTWYEKYEAPNYTSGLENTIGGEEPVIFDEAAMAEGKAAAEKRLAEIKARRGK